MGLMNKLKNILFEEEEIEIPIIEKKEQVQPKQEVAPVYKEMPRKEEVVKPSVDYNSNYHQTLEPAIRQETALEAQNRFQTMEPTPMPPKQVVSPEPTFSFPDFDEEEFESALPKRSTNVMEHERKRLEKKRETKSEDKRMDVKPKPAPEPQKFRPSPIISPVYGILDKNYTPDEITSRKTTFSARSLDVDSVRKKAFGKLDEALDMVEISEPSFDDDLDEKILEEKLEKARTIDELLSDSSDDMIDLSTINSRVSESIKPVNVEEVKSPKLDEIDSLEDKKVEAKPSLEENTLESDLFDLIDSMYENREDGE